MLKRNPVDLDKIPLAPLPRKLLTIAQAAAVLNIGQSSVYDLIEHEGLPYVLVKGAKQVSMMGLDLWLAQRHHSTQAELQEQLRATGTEKPENAFVSKQEGKRRTSQAKARKSAS